MASVTVTEAALTKALLHHMLPENLQHSIQKISTFEDYEFIVEIRMAATLWLEPRSSEANPKHVCPQDIHCQQLSW